jgi:ribosome-associated protein
MLTISPGLSIPLSAIELSAIRAQGCGGQNVNKVSSAIHLRFDVRGSGLPLFYQERLLALRDVRLTQAGVIVIKAQQFRTQEQNRQDALARLAHLIRQASYVLPERKATRPSKGSKLRRLDNKTKQGGLKRLRQKPRLTPGE